MMDRLMYSARPEDRFSFVKLSIPWENYHEGMFTEEAVTMMWSSRQGFEVLT